MKSEIMTLRWFPFMESTLNENIINRVKADFSFVCSIFFAAFIVFAFMGVASATDYYVATWGNNSNSGTLNQPLQNISYATQQAVAGDTIYLINGTWYNERAFFVNSGNATHPITLTAHNGTPILDGQDTTFTNQNHVGINLNNKNYIEISGIEIHNYYSTITNIGSYATISNCILHDTGGTLPSGQYGGIVILLSTGNVTHNTIENCTLYNSGWNTIQVVGNHEPPNGNGIPATHLTIRNNKIYNSNKHAGIDLFGNLAHVIIEGNEFYDISRPVIYTHDTDKMDYITIHNNIFHNISSVAIDIVQYVKFNHSIISNNTFSNISGTDAYPLFLENSYNMQYLRTIYPNKIAPPNPHVEI